MTTTLRRYPLFINVGQNYDGNTMNNSSPLGYTILLSRTLANVKMIYLRWFQGTEGSTSTDQWYIQFQDLNSLTKPQLIGDKYTSFGCPVYMQQKTGQSVAWQPPIDDLPLLMEASSHKQIDLSHLNFKIVGHNAATMDMTNVKMMLEIHCAQ